MDRSHSGEKSDKPDGPPLSPGGEGWQGDEGNLWLLLRLNSGEDVQYGLTFAFQDMGVRVVVFLKEFCGLSPHLSTPDFFNEDILIGLQGEA
jgi:hypothetical protein